MTKRRLLLAASAATIVAVLGVVVPLVPAASASGVLRVSHRVAVRLCLHARTHGGVRSRTYVQRGCRVVLSEATKSPWVAAAASGHRTASRRASSWYQNPVSGSTGDPAGLKAGSDYYLYATGNLFPIKHSTDLVHWDSVGTAFKTRPPWVVPTGDWNPWSPSVLQADGPCPNKQSGPCYYMYYAGLSGQFSPSIHCVGVATAAVPGGPFTDWGPLSNGVLDNSGRPIGCGDNAGYGNIDPAPFVNVDTDGRRAYLYVSTDNACPPASASCNDTDSTVRPTISVIPLSQDLLHAAGSRQPLFSGGPQSWEQAPWAMVVEGPWMEKRNGVYYLFYSGGDWTHNYVIGDARMPTPTGPATKDPNNPILHGTDQVYGPGGGSTITGPSGGDWMLYHAKLGGYNQPRQLFIDPVVWSRNGNVTVKGLTTTRQTPAP